MGPARLRAAACVALAVAVAASACTAQDDPEPKSSADSSPSAASPEPSTSAEPEVVERMVPVGGGRRIYLRCEGSGAPTVVLEGGDDDTSASYDFAVATLAQASRTCVYDRANLGRSDPDPTRRGLDRLVGDLEQVLENGGVPGPYVLVGTSGGGYITAGYAVRHRADIAGMVFVDVPPPFRDPPAPIVEATRWNSPDNVESRDYLQVEKDAWAARRRIGRIPVTVISNEYSPEEVAAAEFPSERRAMRSNVADQRGWLVLSPLARQVVVRTGHAVEEADPALVVETIQEVVSAASSG